MRPSVVLYNEAHKDGEGVGEVVRKDLIGSKGRASAADLLLVVGTSLRVPGTKRMVREFAKAVRIRGGVSSSSPNGKEDASTPRSAPSTPGSSSPRRSPAADEEPLPKAVYLNLDFPVPTREWEGVFDAWVQGDAQEFAAVLRAEIEKEARAKELASERKRKRDEAAAAANEMDEDEDEMPDLLRDRGKKWGNQEKESPTKRRVISDLLASPTPPSTKKRKMAVVIPPSSRRTGRHQAESVDEDDRLHTSPKLTVRIPPPHSRPSPYYVPEVYITSKAPQYLRRYGMMMMNGNMPGIKRQEQHVDDNLDLDIDIDIEDLDVGVRRMDVEDDDALLSSSSSSSSPIASNSSSSESPSSSSSSSSPASSPPSSHKSPGFILHCKPRLSASISRSVSPFRSTDSEVLPQGTREEVEDGQVKRRVSTRPVRPLQKIYF